MSDGRSPDGRVWVLVAALTAVVFLTVWRLSLALDSPLILCAAFALPAVLTLRTWPGAFASFCATAVVGVILMREQGPGGRLAFILVGLAFAAAVMHVTVTGAGKLNEARRALGIIRRRSETGVVAIQRAGVCVVVVDKNHAWLTVNEAAWNAFGAEARLSLGMDTRVELDDEAAAALMHSGSRESWRKLRESAVADGANDKLRPGEALPPYKVTLYDIAGRKTRYCFTVSLGYHNELAFIGFPESAQDPESEEEQSPGSWFRAVVMSIGEPAVIVQSDGAILASNSSFQVLCDRATQARYIFDCPNVHGASERLLLSSVWLPTQRGATDLPDVYMDGAGQAVAARVSPPKAAYTEALLIVFKGASKPVPEGFMEHTRPMNL